MNAIDEKADLDGNGQLIRGDAAGEFIFQTRGVTTMPPKLVGEYLEELIATDATTDDERFDVAFDLVFCHDTLGPYAELDRRFGSDRGEAWAEHSDEAVEIAREWSYALLEAGGEPYGHTAPARKIDQ